MKFFSKVCFFFGEREDMIFQILRILHKRKKNYFLSKFLLLFLNILWSCKLNFKILEKIYLNLIFYFFHSHTNF